MNEVNLVGYVTSEPEIHEKDDKYNITFRLAPRKRSSNSESDFIPCVIFDKYARTVTKYIEKGALISANGKIQARYDKNDVFRINVVLDRVDRLNPSKKHEENQTQESSQEQQYSADVDEADYYAAFSDRGGGYE